MERTGLDGKKWMRDSKRLTLLALLFFLTLSFLPGQIQLKVYLEEVLALGDTFEDMVYQRPGVATDEEGNIYTADLKNSSIKKYSETGELLAEVKEKGASQGQLMGPSVVRYHGGKVYVTEAFNPGILVFDRNLDFMFSISLKFTPTDMWIFSEEQIAVSTLIRDRKMEEGVYLYCVYIYDQQANEIEKVVYGKDRKFTLMNMVSFCMDGDTNVYLAYTWEDRIEKIDAAGETAWSQSLLGKRKVKMRREKGKRPLFGEFPLEAAYKSIALDPRGYLLVLGGHLSINGCQDVYVLNKNGQHAATFTLPRPAHAIHIDNNNFLYTRSDSEGTLRKYSLKYFYE